MKGQASQTMGGMLKVLSKEEVSVNWQQV